MAVLTTMGKKATRKVTTMMGRGPVPNQIRKSGYTATIGMTDFAQKNAGELVYVDMPFEGDEIDRGETACKASAPCCRCLRWFGASNAPLARGSGRV